MLRREFGEDNVVKAELLPDGKIGCYSPMAELLGKVVVQITANLQDYSTSMSYFEYTESMSVLAVVPTMAPRQGGSTITVMGLNFINGSEYGFHCRFHNTVVEAKYINSTHAKCITPPLKYAEKLPSSGFLVSVSVSNSDPRDDQGFTSDDLYFQYYDQV